MIGLSRDTTSISGEGSQFSFIMGQLLTTNEKLVNANLFTSTLLSDTIDSWNSCKTLVSMDVLDVREDHGGINT